MLDRPRRAHRPEGRQQRKFHPLQMSGPEGSADGGQDRLGLGQGQSRAPGTGKLRFLGVDFHTLSPYNSASLSAIRDRPRDRRCNPEVDTLAFRTDG